MQAVQPTANFASYNQLGNSSDLEILSRIELAVEGNPESIQLLYEELSPATKTLLDKQCLKITGHWLYATQWKAVPQTTFSPLCTKYSQKPKKGEPRNVIYQTIEAVSRVIPKFPRLSPEQRREQFPDSAGKLSCIPCDIFETEILPQVNTLTSFCDLGRVCKLFYQMTQPLLAPLNDPCTIVFWKKDWEKRFIEIKEEPTLPRDFFDKLPHLLSLSTGRLIHCGFISTSSRIMSLYCFDAKSGLSGA